MLTTLITGSTGFVGRALMARLGQCCGVRPIAGLRIASVLPGDQAFRVLGDLVKDGIDLQVVRGVDVVVHLAARVHVMNERAVDPLAAFRKLNVEGTHALLQAAASAGVRRFVYVSSIKVNGEYTQGAQRFSEEGAANPLDAYGQSKYEAETLVRSFCEAHDIEWVIVRPPLVYGPGVKANLAQLIKALGRNIPLPVGGLANRRSMVAVENLADFITCCVTDPRAANELFVISDGEDLSIAEIAHWLAQGVGSYSWRIPVPIAWLSTLLKLLNRQNLNQRLCGELRVDSSKAQHLLGWQPIISPQKALFETAKRWRTQ